MQRGQENVSRRLPRVLHKAMQGGEDDLDALLKRFQLQDKKAKEVEIQHNADPPSARLFANCTPIPGAVSTHHFCLAVQKASQMPMCKMIGAMS